VIYGSLFTGFDIAQGAPLKPASFARNIAFVYAYGALQCPLEAVQGRQSALHNFYAGATLGGLGVATGNLGVPFVPPQALAASRVPRLYWGIAVYGGIAFALAAVSGKPI
jgi:hypothetical protein